MSRVVPVTVVLLLAAQAFTAWRREGHGASEILRAALIQPSWWVAWYPRAWRRPGDVWDRLPEGLRRVRHVTLLMGLYSVLLVAPTVIVATSVDRLYERTGVRPPLRAGVKDAGRLLVKSQPYVMVLFVLALVVETHRFTRRLRSGQGAAIHEYDAQRLFTASTANRRFWSRPAIAAILLPDAERAFRTEPRSADEIERALRELPERVPAPERELAERARSAAFRARQALRAMDAELQALEREYDEAEARRLEDKLGALGDPRPDEPAERGRMRELLGQQAALLRGVAARLDSGRRERARRLEQLQALWLQADALRSPDSSKSPESLARLHTLCEQLESGGLVVVETLPQSRAGGISDAETLGRP